MNLLNGRVRLRSLFEVALAGMGHLLCWSRILCCTIKNMYFNRCKEFLLEDWHLASVKMRCWMRMIG